MNWLKKPLKIKNASPLQISSYFSMLQADLIKTQISISESV